MNYSIRYDRFSSIFAVPSEIVTNHLTSCGALALKVIIYILSKPTEKINYEQIAEVLLADKYDVKDALNYWETAGLLSICEDKTINNAVHIPNEKDKDKESSVEKPLKEKIIPKTSVSIVSSRPKLDRGEISKIAKRDPMINVLISEVESKLGKTLNQAERETLVSLYTYAGLPVDFLLMVIGYCVSINKCNIRYIEKTAVGWADKGIDTFEKAELYIQKLTKRNSDLVQVKTAFGIYDRALTEKERKCINCWFNKWGYDITMVRLAYERTIDSIGNISFPYIDKILSNWYQKGIRTPAQASEETMVKKSSHQSEQFVESSFDIEDLDRLITYGK